jgi:site-specific recombinase XerD
MIMSSRLEDLLRSFRRDLRAEGKSPHTITTYSAAPLFYAEWLARNGHESTTDNLTRDLIRDWMIDLSAVSEPATVQTRHKGLLRFCLWAVAEELIDANPMANLKSPTVPIKPVELLSDDEIAALLGTCKTKSFYDRRDEAIIRLLMDCGVRVGELCSLEVEQIDLDAEGALIVGKGRKPRMIYFCAKTSRALDRYLRDRLKHPHAHERALFLGQRGPMKTDGVRCMLRDRGALVGIKGVHPHRFRHSFAHDFLMAGGQERDLKRLAGWSSDTMLERYGLAAADARAKAAAQRLGRGNRV